MQGPHWFLGTPQLHGTRNMGDDVRGCVYSDTLFTVGCLFGNICRVPASAKHCERAWGHRDDHEWHGHLCEKLLPSGETPPSPAGLQNQPSSFCLRPPQGFLSLSECGPVVTQPRGSLQPDPAFVPLPHTPCYTQTPLLLSPQTPCMLSVCPLPRCLANFIQSSNLSLGITNHHSSPTCPSPLTPIEAAPRFVSPPVPCPLPLWTGSCWKAGPGLPPSYPLPW